MLICGKVHVQLPSGLKSEKLQFVPSGALFASKAKINAFEISPFLAHCRVRGGTNKTI